MPNFKLQSYHYTDIIRNLGHLLNRRLFAVRLEFPLTRDEVQLMFVPNDTLIQIDILKNVHQFESFSTYKYIYLNTPTLDSLPRLAMLMFESKPEFYALNRRYSDCDRTKQGFTARYTATLDHLSDEKLNLLVEWINKEITELRNAELARLKISEYFNHLSPSMWHIMAQWETLTMGFDRDMRERARDKPLRSGRYHWHHEPRYANWRENNKDYMRYIDTLLLSSKVLPEIDEPRVDQKPWGSVTARVRDYRKLEGELV